MDMYSVALPLTQLVSEIEKQINYTGTCQIFGNAVMSPMSPQVGVAKNQRELHVQRDEASRIKTLAPRLEQMGQ